MNKLTWLHLSDLHARNRTDWDSRGIIAALQTDLGRMQQKYQLRPDLVFFTGDLAFGTTPTDKMEDQYSTAAEFLMASGVRSYQKFPLEVFTLSLAITM